MRLSSKVDVESESTEILNPIYEEKAISWFVQILIRFIDIIVRLHRNFFINTCKLICSYTKNC